MAVTIRGTQPLSWGTVSISAYINESSTDDEQSEELEIENETGDIVTHISGFGEKHDITLEVIPLTSASAPDKGETLTYGNRKCVVLGIQKKRVKKDVEKWTIKGKRHPEISLG